MRHQERDTVSHGGQRVYAFKCLDELWPVAYEVTYGNETRRYVPESNDKHEKLTERIEALKAENAKLRELVLKTWDIAMSERIALSAHGINTSGYALDFEIRIARDKMCELGMED